MPQWISAITFSEDNLYKENIILASVEEKTYERKPQKLEGKQYLPVVILQSIIHTGKQQPQGDQKFWPRVF